MADGPIVAPIEAGTEALDELADRLHHTDVSTSGSGYTCTIDHVQYDHNGQWLTVVPPAG